MEYSVAIRTLGRAGEKYQRLLNSLSTQTIQPKAIIVYIADGFPLPKETIGIEQYVYVKKGMVAQRALPYNEVDTEYILFLDDDLEFSFDTVERMFKLLEENNADVISPDIFPNSERTWKSELMMTLSGRMRARRHDKVWGYKVMRNAGYSYNANPNKDVYWSQTNAGACFLCRKEDFLKIHFEDELWLDHMPYPQGEDQVMYYKMFCHGLKQLTWYNHHFRHLDAGGNMTAEKEQMRLYGDVYFKIIFWYRFIYQRESLIRMKIVNSMYIGYTILFSFLVSIIKCDFDMLKIKIKGMTDAIAFIRR